MVSFNDDPKDIRKALDIKKGGPGSGPQGGSEGNEKDSTTSTSARSSPRVSGKHTQEAIQRRDNQYRMPGKMKMPHEERQLAPGEIPKEKMFEGLNPKYDSARNRKDITRSTEDHNRIARGLSSLKDTPETHQGMEDNRQELREVKDTIDNLKATGKK